jgi:adenosine deaminase CECR1
MTYRSSLSHDFYQVMAGKTDMTLFGWKQLILWSLEHACMDEEMRNEIKQQWQKQWDAFVDWINAEKWDEPLDKIRMLTPPMPDL